MKLDDAAVEQIIERVTRQVLLEIREQAAQGGGDDGGRTLLDAGNYLHRVQPVVRAGADRIAATLGAGMISGEQARRIVTTWLETPAAGGRHQRRVDKITAIERRYSRPDGGAR